MICFKATLFFFKPADERAGEEGLGGKNLKDKAEELMSKKELATRISKKKAELAPIIKDLKSLRESIDVKKTLLQFLYGNKHL